MHGNSSNSRFVRLLIYLHSKWPEGRFASPITPRYSIQFLGDVFARLGLPEERITDHAGQFFSTVVERFMAPLNIKNSTTALYHPVEGCGERLNRVERKLNGFQGRWLASRSDAALAASKIQIDDGQHNWQIPSRVDFLASYEDGSISSTSATLERTRHHRVFSKLSSEGSSMQYTVTIPR